MVSNSRPGPRQSTHSTILVTGGAGFIGSNFIRHLLENYLHVVVVNLDKLTYAGNLANLTDIEKRYGAHEVRNGNRSPSVAKPNAPRQDDKNQSARYFFIKGDITDRQLIDKIFSGEYFRKNLSQKTDSYPQIIHDGRAIDAVVNFAAESHVDRSVLDAAPFIETNIKGTQTLLDVAKKYWLENSCESPADGEESEDDPPLFLQISTDEVYGALGENGKFTEKSPLEPNNPYAASKASADMLCRSYYQAYDFPVVVTRSSNNFGPFQFPEKLIPLMIRNALAGEELPVYGEGREVRDWLYVQDNCRALGSVLQNGTPGEVYNVGGGTEKRNINVVKDICLALEKEEPALSNLEDLIKFINDPRGGAHDFRYALDSTKIRNELGWKPKFDFEEGLEKTVEWYLNNQDWVGEVITGEYKEYYEKFYGS